jgi:hypothetical protein
VTEDREAPQHEGRDEGREERVADDRCQRHGRNRAQQEQRDERRRGPRVARPAVGGGREIRLDREELVAVHGGVGALEARLELLDRQPTVGGVRREALGGGRPLAVADAQAALTTPTPWRGDRLR